MSIMPSEPFDPCDYARYGGETTAIADHHSWCMSHVTIHKPQHQCHAYHVQRPQVDPRVFFGVQHGVQLRDPACQPDYTCQQSDALHIPVHFLKMYLSNG